MLHALARRLTRWIQIRRDTRRLRQVDDRLLADIGISRSDINRFVRGAGR